MARLAWSGPILFLALALTACAAGGNEPDGSVGTPDSSTFDAGGGPECASDEDCSRGFVCAAVDGVPTCVADPTPPPPGDGTDCSPCPAPGECRAGVCIQPSSTGDFCEFDGVCALDELCIAGRCTHDPRIPIPCTDSSMCPTGQECVAGECTCDVATDCPSGLICVAGDCTPGDLCVADDECAAGEICDPIGATGTGCRPAGPCDITMPNLSGDWTMRSRLHVRDALPEWLSDFLYAVDGPIRFLLGEDCSVIDWGLGDTIEQAVCDLILDQIAVPDWADGVFTAILALNSVLSTWDIDEVMTLEGSGTVGVDASGDAYRGTHTWQSITFYHRGTALPPATPADLGGDWRFAPSPFNASAVCGLFHIDRHDVYVSVGGIVAWIVDTLVEEITDGAYSSLSDVLAALAGTACDTIANAAEGLYAGIGDDVDAVCTSLLADLIDRAITELIEARLGASPITLRGDSPVGPNTLAPGVWEGTLLGSDFPGEFCAERSGMPRCSLGPVTP